MNEPADDRVRPEANPALKTLWEGLTAAARESLVKDQLVGTFKALQDEAHACSKDKGWWANETDEECVDNFLADPEAVRCLAGMNAELVRGFLLAVTARARKTQEKPLPVQLALQHSELSEVLEAERKGNPPSEKLPGFSSVEEEYADVIIRIFDTAAKKGYRLAEAIVAKMAYNRTRPHRHGGKRF